MDQLPIDKFNFTLNFKFFSDLLIVSQQQKKSLLLFARHSQQRVLTFLANVPIVLLVCGCI
jgi:hypothetical protein